MTRETAGATPDFSLYASFYGTQNTASYIAGLDGLRALSVALVVLAHAGLGHIVPGGFGVTVFFFISGFLITNLLISEWVRGRIRLKNFYMRRWLRLSPELFVYVLIGVIVNAIFAEVRVIEALASMFYFMNYLSIVDSGAPAVARPFDFGHLWSLAVEEHFYLVVPFVMVLFGRRLRRYALLVALLCLIVPFYRWFASVNFWPDHLTGGASAYTYYASEARLDSILYGCLLALVARFNADRLRALSLPVAVLVLGLAVGVLVFSFLCRDFHFRSVWRYSVQGGALLAAFYVLYFSRLGAWLLRILELPALSFLGRVSYGIYIWHFVPIFLFNRLLERAGVGDSVASALACAAFAFVVATVIASVSHRYVLGSVASLRRRFGSSPHAPAMPSSPTEKTKSFRFCS